MKTKLMKQKIRENAEKLKFYRNMRKRNNYLRGRGLDVPEDVIQAMFTGFDVWEQTVFSYGEYKGEKGLYEALKQGNEYALEYAVCFIEIRPYFFRSGYMYKDLLRRLNKAPLSESQRERYLVVKTKYQELLKKYREKRGW